jgi:phosphoserine phosphatase
MRTAFCFDLDGTITKEELLPKISMEIGLFEEMSALTEATINGHIPFDKSFLLRCRLLAEIPISQVQSVVSRVVMYEKIVSFIKMNKDNCFVVTGNLDIWLKPLQANLGVSFYTSEGYYEGDKLIRVASVIDKSVAVKELKQKYDRVVAIGDGMGDVPMFEVADIGIAFGATHSPIKSLVHESDYVVFSEDALCRLLNTLL